MFDILNSNSGNISWTRYVETLTSKNGKCVLVPLARKSH